jgi:hypothetical protein
MATNVKIIISLDARLCSILWHIDLLLGGHSVDNGHCWAMHECNNGGGVTIRDTYNCCWGVRPAYVCMLLSHNSREVVFSVLCGMCHDFIRETVWRRVFSMGSVPRKYRRVEFWRWNCRSTEEYRRGWVVSRRWPWEDELEGSLWRLSVWLKDIVTVRLFQFHYRKVTSEDWES